MRPKAKRKKHTLLIVIVSLVLCLLIAALVGVFAMRVLGKSSLNAKAAVAAPVFEDTDVFVPVTEAEKKAVDWQEGWVKHDDTIYAYKEDILTFLIMGIDKTGDSVEATGATNGGQADGLFLAVIDPKDKVIRIVAINRNTMTGVDVYNETGAYVKTVDAQICTQHGFGNGREQSCEYQKKAVERLMYQLPIHGYAAINMSSVATINDAVDGVDVTVLEDMTSWDKSLVEGEEVHLTGKAAYVYTTRRDTTVPGSADMRLARQKQYLNAFMKKAVSQLKKNPASALELYDALTGEMTTDLTSQQFVYLVSATSGFDIDSEIYTLQGETVMGENGFEEFHPDSKALYELILRVFYEPVER